MGLPNPRTAIFTGALGAALLGPAGPALAAESSKPAGGAAVGEVIGATSGALIATAILFGLGIAHRSGRSDLLRRAGAYAESKTGMPAWASIPTLIAGVSLLIALFGMYW